MYTRNQKYLLLFSDCILKLLQRVKFQVRIFARFSPLLALRTIHYFKHYSSISSFNLSDSLKKYTFPERRRLLLPLLVRQFSYAYLGRPWLCLLQSRRTRRRAVAHPGGGLWDKLRTSFHDDGWRVAIGKAIRYGLRWGGRVWRLAQATPAHPSRLSSNPKKPLHVVVDHDAGGGAYAYREHYVSRLLTQRKEVLIWQYLVGVNQYLFEWRTQNARRYFRTRDLESATAFVRASTPATVFFNNLAGWPHVPETLDALSIMRQDGIRLEIFLHDYFALCPAYPLLDRKGNFCGVPMPPRPCGQCLSGHPLAAPFDGLDIIAWRDMWGRFLQQADSISVADTSGQEMFARVYPHISETIRIEFLEPLRRWNPLPPLSPQAPLVVGVIGHITKHKGAGIVEDLVLLVTEQKLTARVVVIGSLESSIRHPILHVTGPYKHVQLPDMLRKYGVTMCLVPSPLPETFCYVAQEIEILGLPLICLNLGAQGVRARHYSKGFVAPTPDAQGCLAAIFQASMTSGATLVRCCNSRSDCRQRKC